MAEDCTNDAILATRLRALVEQGGAATRLRLAGHPGLDAATCDLLCGDSRVLVRAAVAGNPTLNADQLARLASDDFVMVRRAVASHPMLDADLLVTLAGDEDEVVRTRAAENPAAPPMAREVLGRSNAPHSTEHRDRKWKDATASTDVWGEISHREEMFRRRLRRAIEGQDMSRRADAPVDPGWDDLLGGTEPPV